MKRSVRMTKNGDGESMRHNGRGWQLNGAGEAMTLTGGVD